MNYYLSIPLLFFKFWFIDAPIRIIEYFLTVNHAVLQILSLALLLRTFFKPLKNEYRKGLVVFSVVFGMILKSALIFADIVMISFVLFIEVIALGLFILWPFLSIFVLFI
jgi:hypothetical protein